MDNLLFSRHIVSKKHHIIKIAIANFQRQNIVLLFVLVTVFKSKNPFAKTCLVCENASQLAKLRRCCNVDDLVENRLIRQQGLKVGGQ